ncbi:MAG: phosphatase PAP2 family protein, partial [Bacteroidales bacterium]|nr:phosphatase PAP2 family protein [Candidatus Colimorpha onthohippi]
CCNWHEHPTTQRPTICHDQSTPTTFRMNSIEQLDTLLFCWINSHHSPLADWLLWSASQSWSWAAVIAAFFCLATLRREPNQWWVILISIGLCFLLSDRISVMCFKDVVCRPRPCHALTDVRMFHTTCGGLYGFVSSHAANVFSIAILFALRYGKPYKHHKYTCPAWIVPTLAMLWALIVGYSRPYLGKHYPGDVICGAIVGLGIGALIFFIMTYIENKTLTTKRQRK